MVILISLMTYTSLFRDIELILSETTIWAGKVAENVTESEYFTAISSGLDLPTGLKNCSLETELNQVTGTSSNCWKGLGLRKGE